MKPLRRILAKARHKLHDKLGRNDFEPLFYDKTLIASSGGSTPPGTAISDHICTIFADTIVQRPSLIVELGTRGGESTQALIAAAHYSRAKVLSIDIDEQPPLSLPTELLSLWEFVQSDDIEFGRSGFTSWCQTNGFEPAIDLLFIDSSHEYEHTAQEIDTWFRFVAPDGVVLFHDTNMRRHYRRLNNTYRTGWNNERGVIRAVEKYLGKSFDETKVFVDTENGWLIRHYPYSSGLLLLKRLQPATA